MAMIKDFFIGNALKLAGGAIVLLVIACGFLALNLAWEKTHSAKLQTAVVECGKTLENERQAVRDKTALAKAQDAEHAAKVEASDTKIQMGKNDAIQKRRAAGRDGELDRLRRARAAKTDSSGRRDETMSVATEAAGGVDGEGEASDVLQSDNLICIDNTIKLEGWIEWWTEVEAITR